MFRPRGWGLFVWIALAAWVATPASARAEVTTLDGLDAPIVRINLRQANVSVRTWDRPTVQIEGDPAAITVDRRTVRIPENLPPAPISPVEIQGPAGETVSLPAESFVISSLPPGARSQVLIRSSGMPGPAGNVTVLVPSNSALVAAHVQNGSVDLANYRAGTYIVSVRSGRIGLNNVGGDGFAQIMRGPLAVDDSELNRLRARTALGNMVFERCRSRQIEATSVNGSIVYDGGSFQPGLARFDSARGDVAIGSFGAAQLGGRTAGGGKVYTMFERDTRIVNRDAAVNALVAGGGPVVNASSTSGNVYLYDGSLRSRQQLPGEWRAPLQTLFRHALPNAQAEPSLARPALQNPSLGHVNLRGRQTGAGRPQNRFVAHPNARNRFFPPPQLGSRPNAPARSGNHNPPPPRFERRNVALPRFQNQNLAQPGAQNRNLAPPRVENRNAAPPRFEQRNVAPPPLQIRRLPPAPRQPPDVRRFEGQPSPPHPAMMVPRVERPRSAPPRGEGPRPTTPRSRPTHDNHPHQ